MILFDLGEKIKTLRKEKNLSQDELAKKSKFQEQHFQNLKTSV